MADGIELDFNLDLNLADFNLTMPGSLQFESRYIKPPYSPELDESLLAYKNAEALANDIEIHKGSRHFVIVDGTFYFGDFIEALIVKNNWHIPEMTVSTLSMNENNVDSLENLLTGGYIDRLNLIVSAYFYSHERGALVKYIYERLDIDNRFQLAAASSHCKLAILKTDEGLAITMHGSANLRSSSNIEQVMIEENEALYEFNHEIHSRIIEAYKTIDHQVRRNTLWAAVQSNGRDAAGAVAEADAHRQAGASRKGKHQERTGLEASRGRNSSPESVTSSSKNRQKTGEVNAR